VQILLKYAHVFHDDTNHFKATNARKEIPIGDERPIRRPQYRSPYALRQEMQAQVEKMLEKGVIRPCNSPWSAPAILVPKKSPDGTPKYRFCVDFRALNSDGILYLSVTRLRGSYGLLTRIQVLQCIRLSKRDLAGTHKKVTPGTHRVYCPFRTLRILIASLLDYPILLLTSRG